MHRSDLAGHCELLLCPNHGIGVTGHVVTYGMRPIRSPWRADMVMFRSAAMLGTRPVGVDPATRRCVRSVTPRGRLRGGGGSRHARDSRASCRSWPMGPALVAWPRRGRWQQRVHPPAPALLVPDRSHERTGCRPTATATVWTPRRGRRSRISRRKTSRSCSPRCG